MEFEKDISTSQNLDSDLSVENKEGKIIADVEEARQQFRIFWKKDNSPQELKKEVKWREGYRTASLVGQEDEMMALLLYGEKQDRRKEKIENKEEFNFNELVIASESAKKREALSEIAKSRGMEISTDFGMQRGDEEEEHKILKELIMEDSPKRWDEKLGYRPKFYAMDVAVSKTVKAHEFCKKNPIIASDIIVLAGENILEKPKSKKDALNILNNLSGKEINISCGVVLMTRTRSGKELLLKEGVSFFVKLRDFSPQEAEDYIHQQGDNILNIAGVIDYSEQQAQKLIDSEKAIKVQPLRLKAGDEREISISHQILPRLEDYFIGAPRELIEEMIETQKALRAV